MKTFLYILFLVFIPSILFSQVLEKQVVGKTSQVTYVGSHPNYTVTCNFISQHGYSVNDLDTGMIYSAEAYTKEVLRFKIMNIVSNGGSNVTLTLLNEGDPLLVFPSVGGTIYKETQNFKLSLYDANTTPNDKASIFNNNMILLDRLFSDSLTSFYISDSLVTTKIGTNDSVYIIGDIVTLDGNKYRINVLDQILDSINTNIDTIVFNYLDSIGGDTFFTNIYIDSSGNNIYKGGDAITVNGDVIRLGGAVGNNIYIYDTSSNNFIVTNFNYLVNQANNEILLYASEPLPADSFPSIGRLFLYSQNSILRANQNIYLDIDHDNKPVGVQVLSDTAMLPHLYLKRFDTAQLGIPSGIKIGGDIPFINNDTILTLDPTTGLLSKTIKGEVSGVFQFYYISDGDTVLVNNQDTVVFPTLVDTNTDSFYVDYGNTVVLISQGDTVQVSNFIDTDTFYVNTGDTVIQITRNDTIPFSEDTNTDSFYVNFPDTTIFVQQGDTIFLTNSNFTTTTSFKSGYLYDIDDTTAIRPIVIDNNIYFQLNEEAVEDIVGNLFNSGVHTNISVSYSDTGEVNGALYLNAVDTSGYNTGFSLNGDTLILTDQNSTLKVTLPPGAVDTDDQNLSLSGDSLLIDNGTGVELSKYLDNTDESGHNKSLTIQSGILYLQDDSSTLSVTLPVAIDTTFASGDTIFFVTGGDTAFTVLDVPGDNWGSQVVVSDATLTGNGTVANPLSVVFPADSDTDSIYFNNRTITSLITRGDTIVLPVDLVYDGDSSITNELQNLSRVGDSIKITNGTGAYIADFFDNTDTSGYNVSFVRSNDTLYISDGNGSLFAVLPADEVFDGDSSVTNELQTLSKSNDTIYLSDGGFVLDTDTDTDSQSLSIVNDTLYISRGNYVTLNPYINTDTSGYNLTFSRIGDSLFLTDGAGTLKVELPAGTVNTDDQQLSIDSTGRIFTITLEDGGNVTFEDQVGGFILPTDSITFNNNETGPDEGELNWDQTIGFPVFGGVGGISIKLGQDALWLCENQTGSQINKGTVVGVVGALGNSSKFLIAPFLANGNTDNDYLLGIAAEDIPNGTDGYVMHQGKIRQIDLTAYPQGSILYASPSTPGALTTTEPANGFQKFPIAFVVDSSANGTLGVRVKTGEALRDLHDVDISSAVDGDLIYYDAAAGYWKTKQDSVIDDDADPSNEIQTIDTFTLINDTTLQISLSSDGEAAKEVNLAPVRDGNGIFSATNDNTTIADNGSDGKFIATLPYQLATSEFIFNGQANASPTLVIRSSEESGTRSRLRFESNNNGVLTEEYKIESHDGSAFQYFNNLYLKELGTSGNLMVIFGQGPNTGAIFLDKYKTGFSQTSYNTNSTAGILSIGTDGFIKKMQGTSNGQVLTWDSGGFAKFANPTVTTPLTSNEGIEIDNNVIKLGYPTKTSADTNSIGGQGISTKSRFISVSDVAAGEYLGFMQSGQSGYNGPYKDSSYIRFLANDYYYSNGESSSNLGFEYWYDTTAAGIVGYDYSTFKLLNKSYIRQAVNWTGVNSVGDYRFEIESEGDIRLNPGDQLQFMNIPNDETDINVLTIDNNVVSYRSVSSIIGNLIDSTTVTDGNTINFTLTGTDITGEVIISNDPGNRLSTGTDNALFVPAEVDGSITNELQDLQLTADTLSLTLSNSVVDLSPYLDNTDDQTIDSFGLVGTSLNLSLENDGEATKVVDLSSLQDGNGIYDSANESQNAAVTSIGVPTSLNFDANTLYIDGTNNEIGIGTTTPNQKLHVVGTTEIDGRLDLDDGNNSVYIGNLAGINSGILAIGNVFVGKNSGTTNTEGYHNTFVGAESGESNTTGFRNTAVGYESGNKITSGQENTLLGFRSGFNLTTAKFNTFFGVASGTAITTGERNNMIGHEAGKELTDALDNTFIGYRAGHLLDNGNQNVFIGSLAGATDFGEGSVTGLDSASNSIFIGYNTKASTDSVTNVIVIGHDAFAASNTTKIGNSQTTATYLEGQLYIDNVNYSTHNEEVLISGAPVSKRSVNQIGFPYSTYIASEGSTVAVDFNNNSKHIVRISCTGVSSAFALSTSNVFSTAQFAAVYNIHFHAVPNNAITVTLDSGKTWYNEVGNVMTTITLQANQDKIMTFYTSNGSDFYTME